MLVPDSHVKREAFRNIDPFLSLSKFEALAPKEQHSFCVIPPYMLFLAEQIMPIIKYSIKYSLKYSKLCRPNQNPFGVCSSLF